MRSTPMGPRPIRAPEKKRRSAFAVMLNLRADQAKGACDVFDVAREVALEWVREKGHVVAPEDDTRDFVSEDGAVHLHQRGGFPRMLALRLVHPDVISEPSEGDHRVRTPGREWIIDVLLREEDLGKADPAMTLGQPVKAIVHVRVVDADPSQADRPYWALRPLVIPRWVNALHVTYPDSEVRVTGTPLVVDSLVDAENGLLETLDHTPVLAVIPDHPAFPHQGNDRDPRALFDPDRMAFRFEPLARVITVTRDTSEQLVRSFPPDQSWFKGAVLLFLRSGTPGVLAEAKAAGNQSDGAPGPRGFRRFLHGLLGRWGRRGGSRGQSVGVDAVRRGARASAIGASDLAAVRESLYQDLARQLTEAALARTPTEFAELREDIRVWQELEQSDAVVSDQRRIRDLVDQVQEYRTLYEEASAELARLRRPARYTEVAAWCVREFRGQLVLAGKAERSLRDSHYEDLPLVLRLLELLATEYRDWRRGDLEARHRLSAELAAEGVELSKCLTPQQSGRVPRGEYRIRYEGRPFDLDWHLKKGADRDPRHCMRIYFAWDDYSHRVVVGHLTGHLQTASS